MKHLFKLMMLFVAFSIASPSFGSSGISKISDGLKFEQCYVTTVACDVVADIYSPDFAIDGTVKGSGYCKRDAFATVTSTIERSSENLWRDFVSIRNYVNGTLHKNDNYNAKNQIRFLTFHVGKTC